MRNFFVKTFHKKHAVKVLLVTRDKKFSVYYVVPNAEGNFRIDRQTFKIDSNPYYDRKGYPTYIYKYNHTGPINIDVDQVEASHMTPSEYNTAIDNKLARELFNASETMDKPTISMILNVITIAAVLAAAYFLYQEIIVLHELLPTEIPDTGGVPNG